MSWTAARFIFNATPAMAVLGAWGAVGLWGWSGTKEMSRKMRRLGVRTPADRIASTRKAVWRTPQFSAIMLVMIMLGGQHMTYGLDAGIPGTSPSEDDIDETLYNVIPDILRWDVAGFSFLNPTAYADGGMRYLGALAAVSTSKDGTMHTPGLRLRTPTNPTPRSQRSSRGGTTVSKP